MDKINFLIFTKNGLESQEDNTKPYSSKPNIDTNSFKLLLKNSKFKELPSIIDRFINIINYLGYYDFAKELKEELLEIYNRNSGKTTREIDKIIRESKFKRDYIIFSIGNNDFINIAHKLMSRLNREYNIPLEHFTVLPQTNSVKVKCCNFDLTLDSTINDIIQELFESDTHTVNLDFDSMWGWQNLFLYVSNRLVSEHPTTTFEWNGHNKSIRLTNDFSKLEETKRELMINKLNSITKKM